MNLGLVSSKQHFIRVILNEFINVTAECFVRFLGSYDPYAIIGGVCLSAGIARSSGRNLVGLHDVSFRYSGHCCFEYM